MDSQGASRTMSSNRLSLLVSLLGLLVAALPVLYLPASSGPVAFAVLVMKAVGLGVGLGVVGVGFYSYRTGDPRPAVAAGLTIVGLVFVGGIGGFVETAGGTFVPIWAWALSAVLVVSLAVTVTERLFDEERDDSYLQ